MIYEMQLTKAPSNIKHEYLVVTAKNTFNLLFDLALL